MPNASFVQTDFRGGKWSKSSQGRMDLAAYKTGMNECLNSLPTEAGPWTRRPGFRFIAETYYGREGVLRAFRFSKEEAYQAELTRFRMRFIVGLSQVKDERSKPSVLKISTTTPAAVSAAITSDWVDGDVVVFDIDTTGPEQPSTYSLFNRQFRIQTVNVAAGTFELLDHLTGAAIDGSLIDYHPRTATDTVQRVLEFSTPYSLDDLQYVNLVVADDQVIFLCRPPGTIGFLPRILKKSGATQFTFTLASFVNGPYMDAPLDLIEGFNNKLTASGSSGSITVTADSIVGINDGFGFRATDVGRHIWFPSGPPSWSSLISYPKEYKVLGSDNNIYRSLISGNINNNPTTDNGTKWEITADSILVSWLKITAVTSSTVVTATVKGASLTSGLTTIKWRLGLYSDTTGYPSCGEYHEGRLFLAGAQPNRYDASRNFRPLDFSPTEADGSVSDDNSIGDVLNSDDTEDITWMSSADVGMYLGTISGEWLLRASALDDPVTPTSRQVRKMTNYGSSEATPVNAGGDLVFVQAKKRKLQALKATGRTIDAVNISERATDILVPQIEEVAWAQEPMLSVFARLSDGQLAGTLYRAASEQQEPLNGWHHHKVSDGGNNSFFPIASLSSGPAFDGNTDTLFATLKSSSQSVIVAMMPMMSEGDATWKHWHSDLSSPGPYIRQMFTDNGDAFNGLRFYGLRYAYDLGVPVSVYLNGKDYGLLAINSQGYADRAFDPVTFPELDFVSIGTTSVGGWGVNVRWADAPVTTGPLFPLNTIAVIDSDSGVPFSSGKFIYLNETLTKAWRMDFNPGVPADSTIRAFDALDGTLLNEIKGDTNIFSSTGGDLNHAGESGENLWVYAKPDLFSVDGTPDVPLLIGVSRYSGLSDTTISGISTETLQELWDFTLTHNESVSMQDIELPKVVFPIRYRDDTAVGRTYKTNTLLGVVSQVSSSTFNNFSIFNTTEGGPLNMGAIGINLNDQVQDRAYHLLKEFTVTEVREMWGCMGWEKDRETVFFTWGHDGSAIAGWPNASRMYLFRWHIKGQAVGPGLVAAYFVEKYLVFQPTPSFIDSGWTQFKENTILLDALDNNIILIVSKYTSGDGYVLKINSATGDVIWKSATPTVLIHVNFPRSAMVQPLTKNRWAYMTGAGVVHEINLTTGAWSTVAGVATGLSWSNEQQWYDEIGTSIIMYGSFNAGAFTMIYNGDWATAHATSWSTNWNRIWLGQSYIQDQAHRELSASYWALPSNIGVKFTSKGQLLRPDVGQDAGAAAGPAFGKKRRNHWWAASFVNSFDVKIGTEFANIYPIRFTTPGGIAYAAPQLYSSTVSDTLLDDYSFEGKIAWQNENQYPCTITAMGGYIATQDK